MFFVRNRYFKDYISERVKKMLSDEEFKSFLEDEDIVFGKADLEAIIDEELLKPEDEMDTDLIELCLELLAPRDDKNKNLNCKKDKKKNFNGLKMLKAASIGVVVLKHFKFLEHLLR